MKIINLILFESSKFVFSEEINSVNAMWTKDISAICKPTSTVPSLFDEYLTPWISIDAFEKLGKGDKYVFLDFKGNPSFRVIRFLANQCQVNWHI
jgi:hypothetical protein